ncbi:hypothetical protein D477_013646 [Arthrobacter crystallopoietes BAB-32]|uniref:DUF4440 domain-containing protein n=1 Tax=Arthrobacter crystallopoietes BAB-32 TaxID=1246476 RepID=N1UX70_9MICC|nr:DUF4440 domain-containing protein [Arthrobacter crystallopoietes]EMY33655.1 hypothetical protein D477_013646 [Arthrobacter crystallopoietes BAB-32]
MPINDAKSLHAAWAERFNAKDLDGMLELFEQDAVFVPQPGAPTTGGETRQALSGFLELGLPINLEVRHLYLAGDVALAVADWSIAGTAADGSQVDMAGTTADVLRRGNDGWKFAIDNPLGTA